MTIPTPQRASPGLPTYATAVVQDADRLAAVDRSELIDGPENEVLDRLTEIARKLLGVPATFVSVVAAACDHYISHSGLPEPLATARRLEGATFCHLAIASDGPLVIPDTRNDPRYSWVPTVESLGVGAYLGVPIRLATDEVLGSFCAIDLEPHDWTEADVEILVELGHSAEREIGLHRSLAAAESLALIDAITGLPNKRAFEGTFERMAAEAARHGTELAAVFFDLDHFKAINDRWGHAKGDEVLAAVGALANEMLRASDFVARFGGEEFVLLLPRTGTGDAVALAQRVRAQIEGLALTGVPAVTASFGVAVFPDDAGGPTGLLRAADQALYAAKAAGRNRVGGAPAASLA